MKRTISKSSFASLSSARCDPPVTPLMPFPKIDHRHCYDKNDLKEIPQLPRKVCKRFDEEDEDLDVYCSPSPAYRPREVEASYSRESPPVTPSVVFYAASGSESTFRSSRCSSSMMLDVEFGDDPPSSRCLSSTGLCGILLDYLEESQKFFARAQTITFGQLAMAIRHSAPRAVRYIQFLISQKLVTLPWHLVGNFIDAVTAFIYDEDIREATMDEMTHFLRSLVAPDRKPSSSSRAQPPPRPQGTTPPPLSPQWLMIDVFSNLSHFFHEILVRFKDYLMNSWLFSDRIKSPCEFGRPSETLFLCMECHKEHT